MAKALVLAQQLSVVRSDDDERVLEKSFRIELCKQPAKLAVEVSNAVVVAVTRHREGAARQIGLRRALPVSQRLDLHRLMRREAEVARCSRRNEVRVVGVVIIQEREEWPRFWPT